MLKSIKYLGVGLLLLAGCDDQPVIPEDQSVYFPLKVGNYQIYQIAQTIYSETDPVALSSFQLKVETIDSFKTLEGEIQYVQYRSVRASESDSWEYLDTWSARRNMLRAIQQEGNTAFVKLEFPLHENREWNGNTFNTLGEDIYESVAINQPYQLEGLPEFTNTITVSQSDNQDLIVYQDKRIEVYAQHVGLIEKRILQLHYYTLPVEDIGKQKIKSGIDYTQQLIEYGTY